MADEKGQTKPAPNSEVRSLSGIGGLRPQPSQNSSNSGQGTTASNSSGAKK